MRRYKYSALVRLDSREAGGTSGLQPGKTCRVTVRANHRASHHCKFFSALATTSDLTPFLPADRAVDVTLSVLGDNVPDYLEAGDAVVLWRGHDIGRGVITRRLFLWAETP